MAETNQTSERDVMLGCKNGNCGYMFPENEAKDENTCPLCGSIAAFSVEFDIDGNEIPNEIEMPRVKVSNMQAQTGASANQFLIETDQGIFFQSYKTVIAFRRFDGKVFIDRDYRKSRTTCRYRCQFLNERGNITDAKIASGEYTVTNLNRK